MIQSSLVWHLLLISLVIVGHIYSIEECPSEAVLVDNRCFYLVMADDPQGFASVFEARNSCRAETPSGDIASLESREKHRAAFSLVEKIPKNRRPGRVFIGLHDIANESVYEWFNGGDGHEYSLWAPGEPNNLHENNEDCVTVESDNLQWQLDGATGWKDYPCCVRTLINAVFCQIEINSTKQPYDIQQDPLATACFGDWDECESSPCHNQGVCVDKLLSFICVCQPGFTGPLCQSVVTCPPVPVWRVVVPNKVIDREYSTEVNYTCAEGLELSQGVFAISSCSTNATWEPPFQDCLSPNRRAKVRIKKPTTEAQGAVAIGTVGLIFVICELTLMVMMDLNLFCLHIVILKNNVQSFFKYMWLKVQSPMTPVPTESYL